MKTVEALLLCWMFATFSIHLCYAKPTQKPDDTNGQICLKINNVYHHPDFGCFECDKCPPGFEMDYSENVPSVPGKGDMQCVGCIPCKSGHFNPQINKGWTCQPCTNCAKLELMERTACSATMNAVCDNIPLRPSVAIQKRPNAPDRVDESISKTNNEVRLQKTTTHSGGSTAWTIIGPCIGLIIVLLAVVGVVLGLTFLNRRYRQRRAAPLSVSSSTPGGSDRGQYTPVPVDGKGSGPNVLTEVASPNENLETKNVNHGLFPVSTEVKGRTVPRQEENIKDRKRYMREKRRQSLFPHLESSSGTSDESADEKSPLVSKKRRRRLNSLPCLGRDAERLANFQNTPSQHILPVFEKSIENGLNSSSNSLETDRLLADVETSSELLLTMQQRPGLHRLLSYPMDRRTEEELEQDGGSMSNVDSNSTQTTQPSIPSLSFSILDEESTRARHIGSQGTNEMNGDHGPPEFCIPVVVMETLDEAGQSSDISNNDSTDDEDGELSFDELDLTAKQTAPKSDFKTLGRTLGVSDADIEIIVANHQNDVKEQAYQTLVKWKTIQGPSATRSKLYRSLQKIHRLDVIAKLQDLTNQRPGVG